VFFGFIPAGAMIGAIAGALLFAMMALRDNAIAIERERMRWATVEEPVNLRDHRNGAMQKCRLCFRHFVLFEASNKAAANPAGRAESVSGRV
jgi:hypothetical protein